MQIVIIGSGSGAFAAAIYAADHGATKVTIIESNIIGGTCVNVGCVPSKIFIRAAQLAHDQRTHPFPGLSTTVPEIERESLLKQQQERVEELRQAKYQDILDKKPNIEYVQGFAHFKDKNTIIVDQLDGGKIEIGADQILIATGSSTNVPNVPGLTDTPYWTSTEALQSPTLPEHLVVMGASVVATEIAQAYLRLGSKVTMIARSTVLSSEDPEIGSKLAEMLKIEGMDVLDHTSVTSVLHDGDSGFTLNTNKGEIVGDKLLIATGRKANTERLGLDKVGVEVDMQGHVIVDEYLHTNIDNIYAAGDCTILPKYVYIAAAAGTRAAANMLGMHVKLDLSVVPRVVFTDPQVAVVGLTDVEAESQGLLVETRTLNLDNIPRALANFDTRGFIKLVADSSTKELLGAHILAPEGSEIIQTAAIAMSNHMTVTSLSSKLFPYLTMAEGIKLCSQTFAMDVKQLSCCADSGVFEEEKIELPAMLAIKGRGESGKEKHGCCSSKQITEKAFHQEASDLTLSKSAAIASMAGMRLIESKEAINYFFTNVIPIMENNYNVSSNATFFEENSFWIGAHFVSGVGFAYFFPMQDVSLSAKILSPLVRTTTYANRQLFFHSQKENLASVKSSEDPSLTDFVVKYGQSILMDTTFITFTSVTHNLVVKNYQGIAVDGAIGFTVSTLAHNNLYNAQHNTNQEPAGVIESSVPYVSCAAVITALHKHALLPTTGDFHNFNSALLSVHKVTMTISLLSAAHQVTSLLVKSVINTSVETVKESIVGGFNGAYEYMHDAYNYMFGSNEINEEHQEL